MKDAEGIEAGKTFIRYKDVRIGLVSAVELSEDYSKVLVKAKIAKHAAGLMVADAKFWVVEPRISLSGVSGLSTLLSGNYIGFQAGKSSESQTLFFALDEPPIITDEPGRQFVLKTPTLGSLGVGTPIYYRRLNVGPGDRLLARSRRPVGRRHDLRPRAVRQVRHDRDALLERERGRRHARRGWHAACAPNRSPRCSPAASPSTCPSSRRPAPSRPPPTREFTLYRYRGIAMKEPDPVERRYVLYFNESVRGLSTGAPVTLFGLQVGEVTDVGLTYDAKTQVFRPRVIVTFFPDRLVSDLPTGRTHARRQDDGGDEPTKSACACCAGSSRSRGCGRSFAPAASSPASSTSRSSTSRMRRRSKIDWTKDPLELPVVPGSLASIEAKLGSILTKIDKMPLDAIGRDVRTALATLDTTLKDASTLVNRVDTQWVPEGTKTLEDLRRAIGDANRVVKNADATLFSKDSPAPQDLRDTLQEITRAARSIRVLVDYLERHPDALIRGKPAEKQ